MWSSAKWLWEVVLTVGKHEKHTFQWPRACIYHSGHLNKFKNINWNINIISTNHIGLSTKDIIDRGPEIEVVLTVLNHELNKKFYILENIMHIDTAPRHSWVHWVIHLRVFPELSTKDPHALYLRLNQATTLKKNRPRQPWED